MTVVTRPQLESLPDSLPLNCSERDEEAKLDKDSSLIDSYQADLMQDDGNE